MSSGKAISWDLGILLKFNDYEKNFPDYPKNFIPPSLLDPSYVAPNRKTAIIVAIAVLMGLSTIAVLARLWVRLADRRNFGPDDWCIIPAWIFNLAFTGCQILLCVIGGVGMHAYDLRYDELRYGLMLELPDVCMYCVAKTLTKTSILLFYWRLSTPLNTTFRRLIIFTMIFIWANVVATVLSNIFACRPLAATWDLSVRLEVFDCININAMITAVSAIHAGMDFWLVCLPLPLVWRLRLPPQKKLGILLLFGLGFIATASAIVKAANVSGVYNTFDPTWNSVTTILAIQIETQIGLIIACLPALNVYFVKIIPDGWFILPRPVIRLLRYLESKSAWSKTLQTSQVSRVEDSEKSKSLNAGSSNKFSHNVSTTIAPRSNFLADETKDSLSEWGISTSETDTTSNNNYQKNTSSRYSDTLSSHMWMEQSQNERTAWYSSSSLDI